MNLKNIFLHLGLAVPFAFGESTQHILTPEITKEYNICDGCVPRELVHAPGIGFDLSSSYGTAAIRYHDGTVIDIGRVDGHDDYKNFMDRLSAPYKHYGPPFQSPLDEMEYNLDQARRYIRKSRGLPSTEDISTLSFMLIELKLMIQREVHMQAHNIVLSLPYMPNFQQDDLEEALAISELTELESYKHWSGGPLRNVNAAWAGMGMGLCEHWQDIEKCEEEESSFYKYKLALALTYTYDELVVEMIVIPHAHLTYQYCRFRFPDLSYGTWDKDRSNTTYWDIIGKKVVEISRIYDPVDDVVLMGEYAQEKRFLDSIRRAIGNNAENTNLSRALQNPKLNTEYIAARGAAEMAKRWQGETWACKEGDWCKGNRDY